MSNIKHCEMCGKLFYCPPSWQDLRFTCSIACAATRRQQSMTQQQRESIEAKRLAGVLNSPKMQRTPAHINAKSYTLKSPTGKIYQVRNLKLWLEQNAHLYDGTPKQAYNGLLMVKATASGARTTNRMYHWRGWTVEDWED